MTTIILFSLLVTRVKNAHVNNIYVSNVLKSPTENLTEPYSRSTIAIRVGLIEMSNGADSTLEWFIEGKH